MCYQRMDLSRQKLLSGLSSPVVDLHKRTSPSGGGRPEPELLVQIEKDFISLQHFKEIFESAAQGVFGSGWVWVTWSVEERRAVSFGQISHFFLCSSTLCSHVASAASQACLGSSLQSD